MQHESTGEDTQYVQDDEEGSGAGGGEHVPGRAGNFILLLLCVVMVDISMLVMICASDIIYCSIR